MRVLLDENLNWRLVRHFDADYQVTTVEQRRWKGLRNGELLEQAAKTFDVLVTADKSIEFQQNISKYSIGVIIIYTKRNTLQDIQPIMPKVNQVIRDVKPGQVIHVHVDVS